MPIRRNSKIKVIAIVISLVIVIFVFAVIPKGKDNSPINIVIKTGTSMQGIASLLKDQNIIYSSNIFVLFSFFLGKKIKAGEYELRKSMSTLAIVRKMARGERNIYTLKIVEGYNIFNVSDTIQNARIMGKDDFLSLSKNRDFLKRIGITSDSLEGYLAPDTYFYSKEIDADKFLEKIVQRTFKIFTNDEMRNRMEALKMDVHQTLTLASMIEKEARLQDEKKLISAVFHNRLKKNMSLDCDPTVIYGTGQFSSPIKKSHLTTYTPYNTYKFTGLPKGPICSPDKNSIVAALNPADVNYLYFVSRNDGSHVFSEDMKTHNRFVNRYQRVKNTKKQ